MNHSLSTNDALDVFLRGFSATRSFVRPFPVSRLAFAIWMLADAPSENESAVAAAGRVPEVIVYGAGPEAVSETRTSRGIGRHTLCVLLDDAAAAPETSAAYKRLGYRLLGREPLFILETARHNPALSAPDGIAVRRVTESGDANAVAKAARSRQVFPEHLTQEDPVCRLYAAFDGETPVGWVRGIRTHPDRSWVSNLFVRPSHRRRGIARALMGAMLADEARGGVTWSVLLASLTGAQFYPHLGYEERGLLLVFSPRKGDMT